MMKAGFRLKILIFCLCIPMLLKAQIKFEKTEINLGILENWNSQPAEFYFTNTADQKIAILRVDASDEIHARFPANFILPGQTSRIVVYYEPLETGNFSEEIKVFTSLSDKAVKLRISGKVNSVIECPSSDDNNAYAIPSYKQQAVVLDRLTKMPVAGASVKFIDAQKTVIRGRTDNKGNIEKQLVRGVYTLIIDAPGYNIYAEEIYLDKNSAPLVFLLDKPDEELQNQNKKPEIPLKEEKPTAAVPDHTIEGTVIDAKTKQAVFQAGVNLQNINTRINYFYLTWHDGKFRKQLKPGTYLVNIVAKNYEHFQDTLQIKSSTRSVTYEISPLSKNNDTIGKPKGSGNPLYFVQEGIVVSKNDGKPVANAKIRFFDKSNVPSLFTTYKNGKFRKELQSGTYTVVVKAKDYQPYTQMLRINDDSSNIIFALEKPAVQKDTTMADTQKKPALILTEEPPTDSVDISQQTERTSQEPPLVKPNETVSELDRTVYNANNIVFLIDVSGSMKEFNKMDLLKVSMKNLVEILRNIDNVSIITYASKQNVVLSGVKGNEKADLIKAIDSLKPHGFTYGMEGLQRAYDQSKQSYVKNGNNQVILITDGMFNSPDFTEADIISLVKKMNREQIIISVIGFGKEEEGIKIMKKIAKNGGGNYLMIDSRESSESVLVKEIMSNSKIKLK